MFTGHIAFALVAKRVRPSVPLAPLIAAAYGPDVIEITLLALWRWAKLPAMFGSHSIPAVILGAAVVAGAYWLWRHHDAAGAAVLAGVYATHWGADLFTGSGKPTWAGGPTVGFSLYDRPLLDFAVESTLLVIAWLLFWPAGERRQRSRRVHVAPVALVLLQLAFNIAKPVFGIRSVKGAVTGASPATDAISPTVGGPARSGPSTGSIAAWLLHGVTTPPSNGRDMADSSGPHGIVTLVCLTCGKERFYDDSPPPAGVTCEQCGSTVFREFATPTEPDEAAIVTLEEQARSIAYGDASPDTVRDDVRDLDTR